MRASFSVGLGFVSILICWASAGRAGPTTSASRTNTTAIRRGISSSYTKIFRSPRPVGAHADSPGLRLRLAPQPHDVLRLALPLHARQTHEFSQRLQPVEPEHGALQRGHAGHRQRAARVVAELLDER